MGVQALDLVLVALIVYWLYRLTKGTSAIPVFMGLLAIYIIWQVVTLVGMNFMSEILGQFIAVGILAIIIVFQQELRQFLFSIGDRASFKEPPGVVDSILAPTGARGALRISRRGSGPGFGTSGLAQRGRLDHRAASNLI